MIRARAMSGPLAVLAILLGPTAAGAHHRNVRRNMTGQAYEVLLAMALHPDGPASPWSPIVTQGSSPLRHPLMVFSRRFS